MWLRSLDSVPLAASVSDPRRDRRDSLGCQIRTANLARRTGRFPQLPHPGGCLNWRVLDGFARVSRIGRPFLHATCLLNRNVKGTTGFGEGHVGRSAVAQDPTTADGCGRADHFFLVEQAHLTLEVALRGAIRRLSTAKCQRVFANFTDQAGRALTTNLAATGRSHVDFLSELYFVDADEAIQCPEE